MKGRRYPCRVLVPLIVRFLAIFTAYITTTLPLQRLLDPYRIPREDRDVFTIRARYSLDSSRTVISMFRVSLARHLRR
jgi:hypothetical protein